MPNIPSPILIDQTPAGGLTLFVGGGEGGLIGLTLLGPGGGPPLLVEISNDSINFAEPTYPHTLTVGETLRLTRTDASNALSTLRATVPVAISDGAFTLSRDADGFLLTSAALGRDYDGFLTTDYPLTRDGDGFLTAGA